MDQCFSFNLFEWSELDDWILNGMVDSDAKAIDLRVGVWLDTWILSVMKVSVLFLVKL